MLLLAHSIEEWHQVALMHELGHEVFSIGAYIDPRSPGDDKRPALPAVPFHEDLARAVWSTPTPADNPDTLWAAKDRLPDAVLDWADVVICHHVEWRWIVGNWRRLRDRGIRTIWRTVGQSTHENEARMRPLRDEGLEIVRYSPREAAIPGYAGADALIRFWADPLELHGWRGDRLVVGNVTQDLKGRGEWTGFPFWQDATLGLPTAPAGPRSEVIGGDGALSYPDLIEYLRGVRAYLWCSTFPASYTLGLIEAMMVGVPVVAAPASRWRRPFAALPYGADLYEGHDLAPIASTSAEDANRTLRALLADRDFADEVSRESRRRALELFGRDKIREEWRAFLG